jgi:hypothetical protein
MGEREVGRAGVEAMTEPTPLIRAKVDRIMKAINASLRTEVVQSDLKRNERLARIRTRTINTPEADVIRQAMRTEQ